MCCARLVNDLRALRFGYQGQSLGQRGVEDRRPLTAADNHHYHGDNNANKNDGMGK